MAPASEIMLFPGDKIYSQSAAGIKMRDIFLAIGVDRDKHTLLIGLAFKDTLLVGQKHASEVSIAESLGLFLCRGKMTYPVTEPVPLRLIKAGTQ